MGTMTGGSCNVTGAAQWIGRAIGEALLDKGRDVCFADLTEENRDFTMRIDITGTTTFLASPASDNMTGQIIMIDGGMTLV